jgi:hypothetical protein
MREKRATEITVRTVRGEWRSDPEAAVRPSEALVLGRGEGKRAALNMIHWTPSRLLPNNLSWVPLSYFHQ